MAENPWSEKTRVLHIGLCELGGWHLTCQVKEPISLFSLAPWGAGLQSQHLDEAPRTVLVTCTTGQCIPLAGPTGSAGQPHGQQGGGHR